MSFLYPGGITDRISATDLTQKILTRWDIDNSDCLSSTEWQTLQDDVGPAVEFYLDPPDNTLKSQFPDFEYVEASMAVAIPDDNDDYIDDDCINRAELIVWATGGAIQSAFPALV